MHNIIEKAELPKDITKFLETKFDCERESCKGFSYYACLCRRGILSDPKLGKGITNTPCFTVNCEQGSDINVAFERVITQVSISKNEVLTRLETARLHKRMRKGGVGERKKLIKQVDEEQEMGKKKERPTCSHPDCEKKLQKRSKGGMCIIHYKQSLAERGELVRDRPKGRRTKNKKAKSRRKTSVRRTGEVSAYEKFIDSLGVLRDAVDDVLKKAEELGPVVPESEIFDYIKNKLGE